LINRVVDVFLRMEGPTWLVLTGTFALWGVLIGYHDSLPWHVLTVFGGFLITLHSSLVHESVHCLRCVPKWFRVSLFFLPLGVWYPYFLYIRDHTTHHRDANLTDPARDPESFYFSQDDWLRMGPILRKIMIANQTFAGRMVLGPFIALIRLFQTEGQRVWRGDRSNLGAWVFHAAGLIALWIIISVFAGMPWWLYIVLIALPGLSFSLIRSFIEHRAAEDPWHRTAIVETGPLFSLLFLNNNLHVVHHKHPAMKWYEIPGYYRQHRLEILESNGGFLFRSYGEVIRRFLFRPVFEPVQKSA